MCCAGVYQCLLTQTFRIKVFSVAQLQAPMLYCGEQIGNGTLEPQVDIAVDPLDGTTSIALVSLLDKAMVMHICCRHCVPAEL